MGLYKSLSYSRDRLEEKQRERGIPCWFIGSFSPNASNCFWPRAQSKFPMWVAGTSLPHHHCLPGYAWVGSGSQQSDQDTSILAAGPHRFRYSEWSTPTFSKHRSQPAPATIPFTTCRCICFLWYAYTVERMLNRTHENKLELHLKPIIGYPHWWKGGKLVVLRKN